MKRGPIILLTIMLPFVVGAQQSFSINKKLRKTENVLPILDSATISLSKDPSKSFDYIEKALSISIKNGDKNAEALSYQKLGIINISLEQPDLAIPYFLKALSLFTVQKNRQQINTTYLLMADTYAKLNDPANAIKYYNKFLDFAEEEGNDKEIINTKNKLADLYVKTSDFKQAAGLYKNIIKDEEQQGNEAGVIEAQNKLGQVYFETDQKDKAMQVLSNSANIAKKVNDTLALSNTLRQQGKLFRSNRQYQQELDVRQELIDIEKKKNNVEAVAKENLEIGNIYMEQNNVDKAIPYINQGLKISEETGNLQQKSEALQSLSTAYSQKAEYNKALDVYKEYVATVDEIYKQREEEIKSSMQLVTSLNRKLQRLDLIEKELSISDKTILLLQQEQLVNLKGMKARKVFNISFATAFLVMAIASLLIYRSSIQKRKANQMLALKSLRSQMNPHFIYNSLNSVNNYISKNDEKSANKYLSEFSRLMRAVMENSKHDFVSLTSEIEILDLYLKLEHTRFNDKFDYKFEIEPGLEIDSYQIPPMLIQPFIENAIWHGLRYREDKGFLNVFLRHENHHLTIIIEDNGIGRKKSEEVKTKFQKEHVSTGLKNIENRMKIINDLYKVKFNVKVEDFDQITGSGTRVKVLIPVRK